MAKGKYIWAVEYRYAGCWNCMGQFPSKQKAQQYAQSSRTCNEYGYQIKRYHVTAEELELDESDD